MPLKIKKTVKQMVDEANGQIETLPLAEAMKPTGSPASPSSTSAIRASCGAMARSPAPST